jgi:NAD+ synthase
MNMSLRDHADQGLKINCQLVRTILTAFIRNEVTKFGFGRVVVGLSGGVDSSLSASLAREALGPDGAIAVVMPYKTSAPESLSHAKEVAELLGIGIVQIDITPQVDAYFERFPDADRVRRGNKMARERMAILYDQSAANRALVLGTSNKTEFLLGYTTLWGDMACAVNPIGDLYKTQVRQLAAHMGVPAHIVKKAPSADLWAAQTDEEELGFTYEELDRLLYLMVDERRPAQQLAEEFDPQFLQKVRRRMRDTQFKRRMPTIAKVSPRSIDRDFRYSRDWGR